METELVIREGAVFSDLDPMARDETTDAWMRPPGGGRECVQEGGTKRGRQGSLRPEDQQGSLVEPCLFTGCRRLPFANW